MNINQYLLYFRDKSTAYGKRDETRPKVTDSTMYTAFLAVVQKPGGLEGDKDHDVPG